MARSFCIGVDVGASRVAAATARATDDGSILTSHVALGDRHDNPPAVVFVDDNGELVLGDAAERRALTAPERLVREFRRSIGDDVPFLVAGCPVPPERAFAQTVANAVQVISGREQGSPDSISITYPWAWGPHRTGMVRTALAEIGLADVELINEAQAAAQHYDVAHPLQPGQSLVVYDLGGTTFQASVLQKQDNGSFDRLGEPFGIDDLGGANFDDAVLRHVLAAVGPDEEILLGSEARTALLQLRRECSDAKEALSADTEVTIPVSAPIGQGTVRLTRAEFENMIDADLDRTVDVVEEAVEGAALSIGEVAAIVLTGGSTRIPRVAQRLSEAFDRPIEIDADPKAAVALGAARTALTAPDTSATAAPVPAADNATELLPAEEQTDDDDASGAVVAAPPHRWRTMLTHGAVAIAGAAVVVLGAWLSGASFNTGAGLEPSAASSDAPVTPGSGRAPDAADEDRPAAHRELTVEEAAEAEDGPSGQNGTNPGGSSAAGGAAGSNSVGAAGTNQANAAPAAGGGAAAPAAAPPAAVPNPQSDPPAAQAPAANPPAPAPAPAPEPAPEPAPAPAPEPAPAPAPEPAPAAEPQQVV